MSLLLAVEASIWKFIVLFSVYRVFHFGWSSLVLFSFFSSST